MLKTNITETEFKDMFTQMNRANNFSYEGKTALYNYLDNLSEDMGEDIEIDIIAICCEYTEYDNFEELKDNYDIIDSFEDLENYTQVIRIYDYNDNLLDNFIIFDF